MDPRLLKYYNQELQFIREMGGEFANEFPKIASRLGLDGIDCADPYVERLLEGFAFLAGRIQLKLDAEFPAFTQHLLESIYPHYLSPTPSMAVVKFQPDLNEGGLAEGFTIPRGSSLRSLLGKGEQTSCEYRTAHDTTLWPLEIEEAGYLSSFAGTDLPLLPGAKAAIRIRLRCTANLTFDKLTLQNLPLYLQGSDELPMRLYEQLVGNAIAVVARPTSRPPPWQEIVKQNPVNPLGFDADHALLPLGPRSFQGYRLIHEYFAFPARYMFVELRSLGTAFKRCPHDDIELFVILNRSDSTLEKVLNASNFSLFCSPVINLFPKICDRIHLSNKVIEHHVVPDRTRPMDFEVYSINSVMGYGTGKEREHPFLPLYSSNSQLARRQSQSYYVSRREPRLLSSKQRRSGPRSSYHGSEIFLSLVDANEAPFRSDLRQLEVATLCSNRDLALQMPVSKGKTDFTLETSAPVNAVRCITGPTKPMPSWAEGDITWRLISHLSLNYLSLTDSEDGQGAKALRELLSLYGNIAEAAVRNQIDGVRNVTTIPVVRRLPVSGPLAMGRGQEIYLTLEENAFQGTGVFLLGAVLERFFSQYVSINSFTQTIIKTVERGEIMRWPLRTGQQHVL
jgi:type VI secretion system protein ImpG